MRRIQPAHRDEAHRDEITTACRRHFFTSSASGLGALALGSLLQEDGFFADQRVHAASATGNPLLARVSHLAPRAKSCIFLFHEGGPSQLDLFDPKPKLKELHGQPLPASLTQRVRFAFIDKQSATLMGSPRRFERCGTAGLPFSDYLPYMASQADAWCMVRSMHTDQFNHHPAQLMMQCGRGMFGLPTVGAWLNYGLGSVAQNLPGYVVLMAGRGPSGGASLWQSGFLPSVYGGVLFRGQGDPVLNLSNPAGVPPSLQKATLTTLTDINRDRFEEWQDPEIVSRVANYELAYRMQMAAPELIDLSQESRATLDQYGVERAEPDWGSGRGKQGQTAANYARNCLLARRLVERGVRFVNVVYSSWDHHAALDRELRYNSFVVDQPVAALLHDLRQRGLLDETLVVWAGEFGRTPLGENRPGRDINTGRDHHPFAFTILMAGGGIKPGLLYGETDEIGWHVHDRPVHVHDFHATLLHLFGLDHLRLTYRFQGRDFRLTDTAGNVITEWLA